MAYGKLRNREVFETNINGQEFIFTCYSQSTNTGFRHICTSGYNDTENIKYVKSDIISKVVYLNRAWESFRYETVLRRGIDNLDETQEVKDKLVAILIDKTAQEEHEKAGQQVETFKNLWNGLSETNKEHIRRGVGENGITSNDQARAVMGVMALMSLMQ